MLLIIYILFLTKDNILGFFDNRNNITINASSTLDNNIKNEYAELLKITNLENLEFNIVYSKILTRDIYEFYDKITILSGSNAGVSKGDLIINENGVIGLISESNKNSSEVTLLTNNDINMSVKINNAYGILTSSNNEVIVKNIKLTESIKVGNLVYTSGLTSIPENFLIGKVSAVTTDNLNLEYILKIELASDIKHIKYVGVVK